MMERHQSSESLARTPAKGLETVEQGQKIKSILICLCLGLQRGKTGGYAESNGGGKGKIVYYPPYGRRFTFLHYPEEQTCLCLRSVKGK